MKKNNSFVLWSVFIVIVLVIVAALEFDISNTAQSISSAAPVATSTHTAHPASSTTTPAGALDGNTFRYTAYDATAIPSTENYLVTFNAGKINASICNSISGSYTAQNGMITSNLVSTLKACVSPRDIMAAEQIFSKVLAAKMPVYTFDGQKLTITGGGHTIVFNAFAK